MRISRSTAITSRLGARAVAAVEFALLAPFLTAFFLGFADLSIAYQQQFQLSSALAAGARYAFTKGQTETGSTLTSDVISFVNSISMVKNVTVTAAYNNNLLSSSCYCVTGATAIYTGPFVCGVACIDGSGSTAGKYVSIAGQFTYAPMFTMDQAFFPGPIKQTVTVRLQ